MAVEVIINYPSKPVLVQLAPADGKFHGLYAPDGSMYYTLSPGTGFVGMYAPDGSRYVTTNANEISGALFVKFN